MIHVMFSYYRAGLLWARSDRAGNFLLKARYCIPDDHSAWGMVSCQYRSFLMRFFFYYLLLVFVHTSKFCVFHIRHETWQIKYFFCYGVATPVEVAIKYVDRDFNLGPAISLASLLRWNLALVKWRRKYVIHKN